MSVVLENHFDPNYAPSQEEIEEYGKWLGLTLPADNDLMYIAREGLVAPLPENWKACKSEKGDLYYFNFKTRKSLWDHPLDEHYKKMVQIQKEKKANGERYGERYHVPLNGIGTVPAGDEEARTLKNSRDDEQKKNHKIKLKKVSINHQENHKQDNVDISPALGSTKSAEKDLNDPTPALDKPNATTHLSTLKALKLRNVFQNSSESSVVVSNVPSDTNENIPVKIDEDVLTEAGTVTCPSVSIESVNVQKSLPTSILTKSSCNILATSLDVAPLTTLPEGNSNVTPKVDKENRSYQAEKAAIQKSAEKRIIREKKEVAELIAKELLTFKAARTQWLDSEKEKCVEDSESQLHKIKADMQMELEYDINVLRESNSETLRKLKEELEKTKQNEIAQISRKNDEELSNFVESQQRILIDAKKELECETENSIANFQTEKIEQWWKTELMSYDALLEEFLEMHAAILLKNKLNHQSRILQVAGDLQLEKNARNFDQINEVFNLMKKEATERHEAELYEKKVYYSNMIAEMEEALKILQASHYRGVGGVCAAVQEPNKPSNNKGRLVSSVVPNVPLPHYQVQKVPLPHYQVQKVQTHEPHGIRKKDKKDEDVQDVISLTCTDISEDSLLSISPSVDRDTEDIQRCLFSVPKCHSHNNVKTEFPINRDSTQLTAESIRCVVADTLKEIFMKQKYDVQLIEEQRRPLTSSKETRKSDSVLDITLPNSFKEQRGMIEEEIERLRQAKNFIEAQRVEIEERKRNINTAKRNWKKDVLKAKSAGIKANSQKGQLLRNVHEVLDKQELGVQCDERVVRESEAWLESKSTRLEKLKEQLEAVELRSGRSGSLIHELDTSCASIDTVALVKDYFRNESLLCGSNVLSRCTDAPLSSRVSEQQPQCQVKDNKDDIGSKKLSKTLRHIEKRLDKFANVILDNQVNVQRQRTEDALLIANSQSQKLGILINKPENTTSLRDSVKYNQASYPLNTNKYHGDWCDSAEGLNTLSLANIRPKHVDLADRNQILRSLATSGKMKSKERQSEGPYHQYRKTRAMSQTKSDNILRKRVCIDSNPVTFY